MWLSDVMKILWIGRSHSFQCASTSTRTAEHFRMLWAEVLLDRHVSSSASDCCSKCFDEALPIPPTSLSSSLLPFWCLRDLQGPRNSSAQPAPDRLLLDRAANKCRNVWTVARRLTCQVVPGLELVGFLEVLCETRLIRKGTPRLRSMTHPGHWNVFEKRRLSVDHAGGLGTGGLAYLMKTVPTGDFLMFFYPFRLCVGYYMTVVFAE